MSKKHFKQCLTRTTPVGKPVAEQEVDEILEVIQEVDSSENEEAPVEKQEVKKTVITQNSKLAERILADQQAALITPNALAKKPKKVLSPEDQAVQDALDLVKDLREKAKAAKVEKKRLADETKASGVDEKMEKKIRKSRLFLMAFVITTHPELSGKEQIELADRMFCEANEGKTLNYKEQHQEYLRVKCVIDTISEINNPDSPLWSAVESN